MLAVPPMEENEKIIFNTLLKNYEELQRIIRKTEYEIYVGELKSKLVELKYRKVLSQAMDLYPTSLFYPFTSLLLVLPIPFLSSFHDIDRKISDLQYGCFCISRQNGLLRIDKYKNMSN